MKNTLSDSLSPRLAILITIKDRSFQLLKNCLGALANQTFKDFEVYLGDSGSHPSLQEENKKISQSFSFVHYFYLETRGHLWNKSMVLNFLLNKIQNELVLQLDVDLILHPDFLTQLLAIYQPDKLLKVKVIRLKETFNDYAHLFEYSVKKFIDGEFSGDFASGNILVNREKILQVGGYDEFYRFWGAEDIDMVLVLESWGLKSEFVFFENAPVFHQWHPKISENLPKGWQVVINEHFRQKEQNFLQTQIPLKNQAYLAAKFTERPALCYFLNPALNTAIDFTFNFPKEKAWSDFLKTFYNLSEGKVLSVKQNFDLISVSQKSRFGSWMHKINAWFQRIGLSYRLVEIKTYETEIFDLQEVRDFIFYFLFDFEDQILDYFLEVKEKELIFLVLKR